MKTKEIKIEGFVTNISSTVDNHIALGVYGPEGSGKTRLLTTAPDPIGIIPLDRKTRFTVAKVMEEMGKQVVMPKEDFIRHEKPLELARMGDQAAKKYYSDHNKRVMEAAYKLLEHPGIRTVAVDSGTQLWEDILFKNYGRNQRIMPRDRGPANQDMIDFLNAMTGKHFILTMKAKEEWKSQPDENGKMVDKPAGTYKPACFGDVGYHMTVVAEMHRNLRYDIEQGKGGGKDWQFAMSVRHCQANASIQGPMGKEILVDDEICFARLASLVYPEIEIEEFM